MKRRLSEQHREKIRRGTLKSWRSKLRRKHRTKAEIEQASPWEKPLVRNRNPRRLHLEHLELDPTGEKVVQRAGMWLIGGAAEPTFVPVGEDVGAAFKARLSSPVLTATSLGF